MNHATHCRSLPRCLYASAALLAFSLSGSSTTAQENSPSVQFSVYSWECSRSFQAQRCPTELQPALDVALALKAADRNYFVVQSVPGVPDVMDAWGVVFRSGADENVLESVVYEKVDGEWQQLATFAKRSDATQFVLSQAETDRVMLVAVRMPAAQPNTDESK